MSDALLVINAGSSSVKYALYRRSSAGTWMRVERDGLEGMPTQAAVHEALARLEPALAGLALRGVGHRIVHGGSQFASAALATPETLAALRDLVPLAPLHQPQGLAVIEALAQRLPGVPQVACFDTGFHRDWPPLARLVPLPAEVRAGGVHRYGFHGLSVESVAAALPSLAPEVAAGRVIVAHLGSGASLCALRGGRSIDSSFGFTALDGLCMSTRPGALDPGIVLYLFQSLGMSAADVEDLLYRRSGLRGISGLSGDMRELLASDAPAATLAVDYFVYRAAREIGALVAVLGGLDALVFTGGIGEHSAEVRARIAAACGWLGLETDAAANAAGGPRISAAGSRVGAWVIPTDEETVIARHALAVLGLANH